MKLTVLGNYGSFPGAGGACSGYLLTGEDYNILIDCGSGIIARAQQYCRIEDIDAIFLTHLHDDHMADIRVLKYAVETKIAWGQNIRPMKLFIPKTPVEMVQSLQEATSFDIQHIGQSQSVQIKGLTFTFIPMEHPIESYAVRVEGEGKVFVYTGDTVNHPGIVEAAKGADLFLCESTLLEAHKNSGGTAPHLTAKEAALVAKTAEVKKLMLTHFWYEEDKNNYLNEAKGEFGNTVLSEQFQVYKI